MEKRPPRLAALHASIAIEQLAVYGDGWVLDGEVRLHSKRTLDERARLVEKLLWFLRQREYASCGVQELKQFLAYLRTGHEQAGGRWGNPLMTRPVRPRTFQTYYINLKTFFNYLIEEGALEASPMEAIAPPVVRADQIQPFTKEQVAALIAATKHTHVPKRDYAIILFLLDTGVRSSELCSLKVKDVDLTGRRCQVLGKGNKRRTVYFGRQTAKALFQYIQQPKHESGNTEMPLFLADRGRRHLESLTRSGLQQMIERLEAIAGIEAVRCSPHTFRHTFAIEFLRRGGNVFTLQQLLGHTNLQMTNRYVQLAQADLEAQHRAFSPVDGFMRRSG